MEFELEKLRKENLALSEKLWASRENREAQSNYFILINTNYKPTSLKDERRVEEILREFMRYFKENIDKIVTFNNNKRRKHEWSGKYIDHVDIDYVIEKGIKTDKMHLHIALYITHRSNISVHQPEIYHLANEYLYFQIGRKPFVARPKLMSYDRVKEYMTKSNKFQSGIDWVSM